MKQTWINLESYGLRLAVVKTPQTHFLVIAGKNADQYATEGRALGFTPHKTNKTVMHKPARVRADGTLDEVILADRFIKAFPQAVEVAFDPSIHFMDHSAGAPAAAQASDAAAKTAAGGSRLVSSTSVGLNRFGREVFDADGVRWFRDERGTSIREDEPGGAAPSAFLRAIDYDGLVECAEGLVEQAWRAKILRSDDLDRFIEVVAGASDDAKRDEARRAVSDAMFRWLARRDVKTMQEAFVASGRLADGLSFLTDGRGSRPTPSAPIALAVQRAIGTEATLRGRTVTIRSNDPGVYATNAFKSALSTLSSSDAHGLRAAKDILAAAKTKADVSSAAPNYAVDAIVLDLQAARGAVGPRQDLIEAESALRQRNADGVSIFMLDAPTGDDEVAQFEAWRADLAANYVFEGEAHVDGALVRGKIGSPDRILLAVGRRLEEPSQDALPPVPTKVGEWSSLWTWTTEVVAHRAAHRRVVLSKDVDVSFNAGEGDRNPYQAPYVSASAIGTPRTMTPRNLEGAMRDALARIVKIYGDIDDFVAREYGYTKEELSEIFSPEQIDALALEVHAENRGRAFLNGDQTGVGKGRFLAACMRRRLLKGGKVVFLTERETNLSDIWRDIVNTRSAHLFKPLVMNADAAIIDAASKGVLLRGTPSEEMEKVLVSKELPERYNAVLGTYSQINKDIKAPVVRGDKDLALKSRWARAMVDRATTVVLDESHNAAGDGNIADNVTAMVEASGHTVYSSATFAADARRMAFYAPLFPDGVSVAELSSMMQKGGEVFQEVLSGMLVKDGVMVRREFDLSKLVFETVVDTTRFERNRALMDTVAPILFELSGFASTVDARIKAMNAEMAGRRRNDEADGKKTFHITRTGFGSPLYTISRLFVAALKVDIVAEDAIKILQNGGKPIILVENTMQQLFEELADAEGSDDGVSVDMKALFNRILRNMTTVSHVNAKNERVYRDVAAGDAAIATKLASIRRLIDAMPTLSLSVIDDVRRRIEDAGFTTGEITGRTLEVRNGRIMRRAPVSTTVVKNAFNDGEIDALVINTSGATGIDLHASKVFRDRRQRFMLELQPPADVVRKMQARGRPNRYDQIVEPVIRAYLSGLPVEMRLAAMDNAKLRKLSANTTSNRDTAQLTRDVPDLINPIGDAVCSRYAENRPELMRRLGFRIGEVEGAATQNALQAANAVNELREEIRPTRKAKETKAASAVADSSRTANEILARLIMLPVDLQTKVCDELIAEFNAEVEEMEARGETPLRSFEMPGLVHPQTREVFDGADIENPDSVFHEPMYLEEVAIERLAKPMLSTDLAERIELGEMASGRAQPCIDRLRNGIDEILQPYLPEGVANVADAVARNIGDIAKRKEKIENFTKHLEQLRPGKEITFTLDDTPVSAIITRIDYPNRGYEHVTGMYGIEFARPGDEKPRVMRIDTLTKDPNFKIGPGLEAEDYADKLERFDNAVKSKLSKGKLLTNNIFRAMRLNVEHNFGRLVTFRSTDGVVHRGISVSKRHHNMKATPVEIPSPEMAYDAVVGERIELNAASALDEKTFLIRAMGEAVELRLPPRTSKKYGHIYDHPRLVDLATSEGAMDEGRKGIVVQIPLRNFADVSKSLYDAGARFWTISSHRDWALRWHNDAVNAGVEPAPMTL